MTREEFTERVGLNVSDGIFEVWNGVYMSSDKDKDEFCKPFATKKGHLDLSRSMVIEIVKGLPLWEVDRVWLKNNLK